MMTLGEQIERKYSKYDFIDKLADEETEAIVKFCREVEKNHEPGAVIEIPNGISASVVPIILEYFRNKDVMCEPTAYPEKDPQADVVNHPAHYTNGKIECIEAIEVVTDGLTGFKGYCVGNIFKYLWRWNKKNGLEDLKKARWYLDKLIAKVENE